MARKPITKRKPKPAEAEELPPPPRTKKTSWGKLKLRYLTEERRAKFIDPEDEEEYSS